MAIVFTETFDVSIGGDNKTANCTRVTSPVYAGAGAAQFNPVAETSWWEKDVIGGVAQNCFVYAFYARYDVLPSADVMICQMDPGGLGDNGIAYDVSSAQFKCADGSPANGTPSGPSITTGVWYRIDIRVDASANPWVLDGKVNGTDLTQNTRGQAAATASKYKLGANAQSDTYTLILDEFNVSHTAADYPLSQFDSDGSAFIPAARRGR